MNKEYVNNKKNIKHKKSLKKKYAVILYSVLFILFSFLAYIFYVQTFVYNEEKVLSYSEKSTADYSVKLKKNNYYEVSVLPSGMNYIANLIDKINVSFGYNFNSSEKLNYNLTYSIDAITRVYDDNEKNKILFEKKETLVKPKTIDKNDVFINEFKQDVIIDYQHFNTFVKSFKSSYALSSVSDLTILLNIETNAKSNKFKKELTNTSVASLVIPLTEQTINIKIESNNIDNEKYIVEDAGLSNIDIKYAIAFLVAILFTIVYFIKLMKVIRKIIKSRSKYDVALKKILKDYDSIIANVENPATEKGYEVFILSKFEELRDVHDNLGVPILFNEIIKGELSEFVIINDEILYKYLLDKDKMD